MAACAKCGKKKCECKKTGGLMKGCGCGGPVKKNCGGPVKKKK